MMSMILTRLFLNRRQKALGLDKVDTTQHRKHQAKKERYAMTGHEIAYRVFYDEISTITRQVWRFLKTVCQRTLVRSLQAPAQAANATLFVITADTVTH